MVSYFADKVRKWDDDITISIEGKQLDGDLQVIDSIIEELNPLIYPVKIRRTNEIGSLLVKFTQVPIEQQGYGNTKFKKNII